MELYRVSQGLSGRVSELVERYASTMNLLSSDVEHFAAKVEQHLMKMGFSA
jgi:type I restriction enzyme M protein